jgi:hypothetical protein
MTPRWRSSFMGRSGRRDRRFRRLVHRQKRDRRTGIDRRRQFAVPAFRFAQIDQGRVAFQRFGLRMDCRRLGFTLQCDGFCFRLRLQQPGVGGPLGLLAHRIGVALRLDLGSLGLFLRLLALVLDRLDMAFCTAALLTACRNASVYCMSVNWKSVISTPNNLTS